MRATIRKSTTVRRDEIARAVLSLIGTRGLTALTTANLAAHVGVTSGALFRHFASQDDILRHATRHAVARIETTFPDPGLPPTTRLRALAANRVRLLGRDAGLAWFVRSEQALLVLPPDAASAIRGLVHRTRTFLLETIRDGAADGSLRRDIAPEVLLILVLGTIHTLIGAIGAQRLAGTRRPSSERVLDGLMRVLAPSSIADKETMR